MNFAEDLYAGTGDFYLRFRVPYPQDMIDQLRDRAGLDGSGHLLDLACGPGTVAIRLAPYVAQVTAADLEPNMIDTGRRSAEALGLGNIRWQIGRAEELAFPAEHFEMVTIGNAFHRLDRPRIAALARDWLTPGGTLALLWTPMLLSGPEGWKRVVRELVTEWADPPASRGAAAPPQTHTDADVLHQAGFAAQEECDDFVLPFVWSADSILGHLHSTSFASQAAFGDRLDGFEQAFRRELRNLQPDDQFSDTIRFAYTLARRGT